MSSEDEFLANEAEEATKLLRGKEVSSVFRHRKREVVLEFTDGTRLFVDASKDGVELSITEGREEDT